MDLTLTAKFSGSGTRKLLAYVGRQYQKNQFYINMKKNTNIRNYDISKLNVVHVVEVNTITCVTMATTI